MINLTMWFKPSVIQADTVVNWQIMQKLDTVKILKVHIEKGAFLGIGGYMVSTEPFLAFKNPRWLPDTSQSQNRVDWVWHL